MTEAELAGKVLELAGQLGLLAHWCRDSRRCRGNRGFPDLLIAGPRGIVFAELKAADGMTSADQDGWLWTLWQASKRSDDVRQMTWRPADWENGFIRQLLESLTAMGL